MKATTYSSINSEQQTTDEIVVRPIPKSTAKELLVREHYLHSFPGGTKLAFGVFVGQRLLGAATMGVGPFLGYSLVEGARPEDCITLTRLWLSDELPKNSESRALGIVLKALRRNTSLKFSLSYTDPAAGHIGTIYQATNWIYTGLSSATPLYIIKGCGCGTAAAVRDSTAPMPQPQHSRSFAAAFGTHSIRYLAAHGVRISTVPQAAKHRYIYFIDPSWRSRLKIPTLPYPKKDDFK
jgi:hypothetical protein